MNVKMKKVINFWLLLMMLFWGGNVWASKTVTIAATSPSSEINLTKFNVSNGTSQTVGFGDISLTITAASGDNASWNTAQAGSNHGQTIALAPGAGIVVSGLSSEIKITKIAFSFEKGADKSNKGYFAESSATGGTLDPSSATGNVDAQTWTLQAGASSVSFTNPTASKNKAYVTSIEVTYETDGLDNHTVQSYPYTWNFQDESQNSNWQSSVSGNQFVETVWTHNTNDANEYRNNANGEPTVSTGYDVDLIRGLRFTGHVCADYKNKLVAIPKNATITIPSLLRGQKIRIVHTGVNFLPTTNLEIEQERSGNVELFSVKNDGDAVVTVDPQQDAYDTWGVWISSISVLDAAPVLTMTSPANKAKEVDPNTLSSITVASDKALWAYDANGVKASESKTVTATLTSGDEDNDMTLSATFTAGAEGVKVLTFNLPAGKKLESSTTYTLNIPANTVMETSGTGNENVTFTFKTKGLTYLGAYNGDTKIEQEPYSVSNLADNRVVFRFEESLKKTDAFKVIVSDGSTVTTYGKDNANCGFVNGSKDTYLYVPITLKAGKYISINIEAGSLQDVTEGSTLKNNQIVLHLTSSVEGTSLSMTTPYNHDEAPVSTRIILSATQSAKDKDGNIKVTGVNIKSNVQAKLVGKSADGTQTHDCGVVTGIVNGNKLVFTNPAPEKVLRPNYTYTLTLQGKGAELNDNEGSYLDDKSFVFTTASITGNAPVLKSTYPEAESTIAVADVQPTSAKTIEVTFNEDIQLLDGALVFCRPMGGSEAKSIYFYNTSLPSDNNLIHVEGNKLWFNYAGQDLFYGMRYEVTIPVYTIVGEGGMPLTQEVKFCFDTPKSAVVTDSRSRKDVYTWDFTHISDATMSHIKNAVAAKNTYWGEFYNDDKTQLEGYGSALVSNTIFFNQGQEIKADGEILPEFKGLLINLKKRNSNRFIIRLAQGDKPSYVYLKGNTHYVTVPSVPKGARIYVERGGDSKEIFNLNSIGVDSLQTFTNKDQHAVSIYQVKTDKDVTFCVQDLLLYRIAVVKDFKTIGNADKNFKYATYSQTYPVDYSLNETLEGTAVTAYGVSTTNKADATYVNFTPVTNNRTAAGEGVVLTSTKTGSGNTESAAEYVLGESHPVFTTEVNTTAEKMTDNALVGTGSDGVTYDKAKQDATAQNAQNYILTSKYFHLDKEENQTGDVIDGTKQCFYKWVKGNVGKNLAYLQLANPTGANAAKTIIYLDWFGQTTGIQGSVIAPILDAGSIYTLDGIKVSQPLRKGIYIKNGKKFVVK